MKRSTWTEGLKGMFVSFLGMPEFEAGKAAAIAADHAGGPWDAERVAVPEFEVRLGETNDSILRRKGGWLGVDAAERAAEILNGYEAAREAAIMLLGPERMKEYPCTGTLRAFFQIEEE